MGIALFGAGLVAHWWMIIASSPVSVAAGISAEIVFFCFVAVILLFHVFGHERVTSDTIAGSICVYLLIGIIWTFAYQAIYFFDHSAFRNVATGSLSPAATVDLVYYSFSTLTTLGYGDITPLSKPARMFAVTEAMVGQIYLTVLVARLVGLYAPMRVSRAGHQPALGMGFGNERFKCAPDRIERVEVRGGIRLECRRASMTARSGAG